jgi:nucleoside-diphosphate-sugar epimerase
MRDQLGLDVPLRKFLEAPSAAGLVAAARTPRASPRTAPAATRRPAPVLVTGATGMVGSFVVAELRRRGRRLRILVREGSASPARIGPADELVPGDLADPDSLRRAADGTDGIVHLAATFADWRVDVAGTERLAAEWRDGPLVLMSSTDVYPWSAPGPIPEDHPLDETSGAYARGKVLAERLAMAEAVRRRRDDVSILRPPYVWGPHPYCRWQLRTGVGHAFHRALRTGTPIVLPEDGTPGLSWVDARDLARLVADCLERPVGGALNAVGGRLGWADLYAELGRLTGRTPGLATGPVPADEFHARVRWYATAKLAARGFSANLDWRRVLAEAVAPTDGPARPA